MEKFTCVSKYLMHIIAYNKKNVLITADVIGRSNVHLHILNVVFIKTIGKVYFFNYMPTISLLDRGMHQLGYIGMLYTIESPFVYI